MISEAASPSGTLADETGAESGARARDVGRVCESSRHAARDQGDALCAPSTPDLNLVGMSANT